jgi:transposase-like protein
MFKRRRFPVEIILVCVRWYCKGSVAKFRSSREDELNASGAGHVRFQVASF